MKFLALLSTAFSLSTLVNARLTSNPMIGKTLKFSYHEHGYEYSSKYISDTVVEWKRLKTPDNQPIKTGTENYGFRELSDKVYLITWSEDNGTDVNHVIDMNESKIFAHVTFKDGQNTNGRRKVSDREGLVIDQTLVKRGYTGDL